MDCCDDFVLALADMTNHIARITLPDEITPLRSPNTIIIKGSHCLYNSTNQLMN